MHHESFTRETGSARRAIVSALEDVKGAIPSAQLIEVSSDLAGLTGIAQLVGVTRQNMRKLMMINVVKESQRLEAPVGKRIRALVG